VDARRDDTDVAIIGGGPAGSAAAIACAARGLRVRLFERTPAGGAGAGKPGETLHPGIEPLLAQLGIGAARLDGVVGARHEGVWVDWNGRRRYEAFGADAQGPWRGFQVRREAFDAMLLERAAEAGAVVRLGCGVSTLLMKDGAVAGLETADGPVAARVVIDASGRWQWLCRQLGIARPPRSPRLIARYGYREGACPQRDAAPQMQGDSAGWQWTAMVRPGVYQWTRVLLDDSAPEDGWVPDELRGLTPIGAPRGADVTWRIAAQTAMPGWYLVGDAAAVLDPTSSHGVLKAMMSSMAAAHLIAAVAAGAVGAESAAKDYHSWLAGWFNDDMRKLARFYAELGMTGFGDT
jgi:flavin-dependent dehydrogenase